MPSNSPLDLNQVHQALQRHRHDFRGRRIPDGLRGQVVDLLATHPRKQVINTLGISYKMLSCWEQQAPPSLPAADLTPVLDFVSVPLAQDEEIPDSGHAVLTPAAITPNGTVAPFELRLGAEVVLAFSGASAGEHCLQLLQGLGYGRNASAVEVCS